MDRFLHKFDRIMLVGYAMTGKTTIASYFDDREVIHTDDFIGKESEIKPQEEIFLIEGVHGFRMLRSGFEVDAVVYLRPKFEALAKHVAQRKACDTIWSQYLRHGPAAEILVFDEDALIWLLSLEERYVS